MNHESVKSLVAVFSAAVVIVASGATGVKKAPVWDKRGNPTPLTTILKPTPVSNRVDKVKPVAQGVLLVRPLFESASVVWGSEKIENLALEYRAKGASAWQKAPMLAYFPDFKNYRASILNLSESTDYEMRLAAGADVKASAPFRTWSSEIKVAKTVVLDPATTKWPVIISDKGNPDGWIRYTIRKGSVIDTKGKPAFGVYGAEYVLLDDMVMRGGREPNMVKVANSKGVRIRNCEIFDWGRDGKHDYARKGHLYEIKNPKVQINFDGAILISHGASEVVVERCYIHDPHSRATSWYYAHPSGPEAVVVGYPEHSTVLRWNDFIASDIHPWNDAVESDGNFADQGGFNRDAEIYGNLLAYANDDSIELDGGQQNVRCFQNRFEGAGCGVSIQGCMVSPTYVYDNLFTGIQAEHGLVMQTIKTSSFDQFGNASWAWIADNTFWGEGTGVDVAPHYGNPLSRMTRWFVFNNRFSGELQELRGRKLTAERLSEGGNTFETNRFDEALLDTSYPKRPLAFLLDRAKFTLVNDYAPKTVKAKSTSDKPIPFEVRINSDFDWLSVEPAKGVIPAHGEVAFTVRFNRERMRDRRRYRSAFLVRTPEGLSRAVTIWSTTDFEPPYHAEKPGETAVYATNIKKGDYILADKEWKTYELTVPKDGTWYFVIHGKTVNPRQWITRTWSQLEVIVDDEEPLISYQQFQEYPFWTVLMPGCRFGNFACPFELKAGKHVVKIRRGNDKSVVYYDGVAVTDSCGSFEPR